MNYYMSFLLSFVLGVVFHMTQVSIARKEPVEQSVIMGGITGACFMLLVIQVSLL